MDPNEKEIKEAIKHANLPKFPDPTEVHDNLRALSKANVQHTWRQRGPFLVCTSCTYEHSQWIGTDKHLTGFTEGGQPILS